MLTDGRQPRSPAMRPSVGCTRAVAGKAVVAIVVVAFCVLLFLLKIENQKKI